MLTRQHLYKNAQLPAAALAPPPPSMCNHLNPTTHLAKLELERITTPVGSPSERPPPGRCAFASAARSWNSPSAAARHNTKQRLAKTRQGPSEELNAHRCLIFGLEQLLVGLSLGQLRNGLLGCNDRQSRSLTLICENSRQAPPTRDSDLWSRKLNSTVHSTGD
jgi:hypothetical protein